MKTTGFLLTLGLGVAAGAVVSSMLPQSSEVKKAVESAAESTRQAAKQVVQSM
ncbi:MAG: hypothetical protein VB055_01265 [Oscillospiraceae bacterium]|nr:hypothetical protein [Oscillospiraceae bacterium]